MYTFDFVSLIFLILFQENGETTLLSEIEIKSCLNDLEKKEKFKKRTNAD